MNINKSDNQSLETEIENHKKLVINEIQSSELEKPKKKRGSYKNWMEFRQIADDIELLCDKLYNLKVHFAKKTAARDLSASLSKKLMKVSNNQQ